MTVRLYDSDSYLTTFSAAVVRSAGSGNRPAVLLDRTAFYPSSGGQPHDTGTLDGVSVLDVMEQDGGILHVLESPIRKGRAVTGRIDWGRRLDHMQQHTGQHILSRAFILETGAETVGFHLGSEICTVDLDKPGFTDEEILNVENLANQTVMENRTVRTHRVNPEEAVRFDLRKTPVSGPSVRVVEIDGFDANGCCGTHLKSTGEAGLIKIQRTEKYKGGTRVTFLCGFRALADYQKKQRLTGEAAAVLNGSESELIENLERWRTERKQGQKRMKDLARRLTELESAALLRDAEGIGPYRLIVRFFPDRDPEGLQASIRSLVRQENTVALLGCTLGKEVRLFLGCHPSIPLDMEDVLRQTVPIIAGRGGGTANLAQGAGSETGRIEQALTRSRELVLQRLS